MSTITTLRKLDYSESSLPFKADKLHAIDPSLNPDDYRFIWRERNSSDSWWFEHKVTEERIGIGYTDEFDNSCFS